jgi:hypothetical protein
LKRVKGTAIEGQQEGEGRGKKREGKSGRRKEGTYKYP